MGAVPEPVFTTAVVLAAGAVGVAGLVVVGAVVGAIGGLVIYGARCIEASRRARRRS